MGTTDTSVLFRVNDGAFVMNKGLPFTRPNGEKVYALKTFFPFVVDKGSLHTPGNAGDYVVYAPNRSSIWSAAADYVEQHYKRG